jgi:hypothetical protein
MSYKQQIVERKAKPSVTKPKEYLLNIHILTTDMSENTAENNSYWNSLQAITTSVTQFLGKRSILHAVYVT